MTVQHALEIALQHHEAGRLAEAEAIYRQILASDPRHADSLHLLGVIAHQVGRNDVAADLIRQAIALAPEIPRYHTNLGEALRELGQLDEAIASHRRAIALRPDYAEAHSNLSIALGERGEFDEAVAACNRAIAVRSDYAEAHINLGNALRGAGRPDEAVAAFRKAVLLNPDHPEAHINLGVVLRESGQLDGALASFRQAIALKPNHPGAHCNLGVTLHRKGQLDAAITSFRHAIALQPTHAEARTNLGLSLLLRGDFREGWEEHEWRLKRDAYSSGPSFTQPWWDGSPLEGRAILLHAEQGFGDALQFVRYLPLVAQRGGQVIVECQPELHRLVQTMSPDVRVVARGQALPPFDLHCPLLSLPRLFATDLASIPSNVPYLRANPEDVAIWRQRLAAHSTSFKVGLVWAGSPTHKNDRNRSLKLAALAPLAGIPGLRFVSLQKGAADGEAATPPPGMEMLDVAGELKDFADTAALIANLDLVIAVDTAVAHLVGAMGRPVWVLLPFVPDWRWMLGRTDSPWYPTMRLFRQPRPGDWEPVIADVRKELGLLVKSRGGTGGRGKDEV